ncbi:MAG: hypothetical protein E6R03_03470 [Hyphomicrobiaceae bacterium]|nr:MAG: hypothetical protein E6R03_03470 [Hyphomicrobiaceae bacterium]
MAITAEEILQAVEQRKPRGWKHFSNHHAIRLAELANSSAVAGEEDPSERWEREVMNARPVGGIGLIVLSWLAQWALQAAIRWAIGYVRRRRGS